MADLSALSVLLGRQGPQKGLLPKPQMFVLPGKWPGLVQPGNIDLNQRPVVKNKDGSISTVKSISFNIGGHEVLIPQVVGNKVVSPKQALAHFMRTGQHLGMFADPQEANAYAESLHNEQATAYG